MPLKLLLILALLGAKPGHAPRTTTVASASYKATALDITAPTAGTAIVISSVAATTLTATWGAGTDLVTAQAALSYKLVRASTSAAIDTVAEIEAGGGTTVMDWTVATVTKAVTGLTQNTSYYFAALVKDAAGNMAIYAPVNVITEITNAVSTLCQGTNDVIDFGDVYPINLSTTEVTLSLWINPTALSVADVIGKAQPFVPTIATLMGITADGRLFGYFGSAAKTTQSASATQIATGTWYHIAYTVRNITGTFTGNIWLNGVKQGSDVTAPGTATGSGTNFRVCASKVLDAPDTARPFSGYVDEVTVWNVGMTVTQVQAIYNSGVPINPRRNALAANLTSYWRAGDGDTYPTWLDPIGGLGGTMTNMAGAGTNFTSTVP